MIKSLIKTIIILSGTVGVFIPTVILYFAISSGLKKSLFIDIISLNLLGLFFFAVGLVLAFKTVRVFVSLGKGTPAPWDPPKNLVVVGPYRYVRNPMIIGMLSILLGEALFFGCGLIFVWAVIFFIVNTIYFPKSEERDLADRFGDDYLEYKKNVPRWIPRLKPWDQK